MSKEREDDATDRTRDSADDAGRFGRGLLRALRNTGISVLYQDRRLRYVWAENAPRAWSDRSLVAAGDEDFLPPAEAARILAAKRLVLGDGEPRRLDLCVPGEGGPRWFDVWIDADRGDDGAAAGIFTTTVEITEQKHREQTLRALLREVSHRSRNLLAIIQSIATQTGRHADGIDDFLDRFRGRLQSIAASQDLVTSSNWRGADLHELVAGQVMRYCADPVRNLRLEGSNPWLDPNAALHVGLALHELAVNSVSHGALSGPEGVVTITATPVADDGKGERMELAWREPLAAGAPSPRPQRFGSIALERIVPASIGGTARLGAEDGTLFYLLSIPARNFEIGQP